MRLLIVSALSGSGKSIALDTLEDCGYYCIDNLPLNLLQDFINHVMLADQKAYAKTAIGIDARNQFESLDNFSESLKLIREKGIDCEVIFLPPYSPDLNPMEKFWANISQSDKLYEALTIFFKTQTST